MSKPESSVKLCECGCGEPAPIATKAHGAGKPRKGEAFRFKNGHQHRLSFAWTVEDRGYKTPCHIWAHRLDPKGYGIAGRHHDPKFNGQPRAHRVAWQRANGPIPEGLYVLHRCDVPACVNPDHLFVGTQTDNMQDMLKKGRGRKACGESHPRAKLTTGQVEAILRAKGVSYRELAAIAGVSISAINHIKNGRARRNG